MNPLNRPPGRPNRSIASAPKPATTQGAAENRTFSTTYITKVGTTDQLYDGSRLWAAVTLNLETAGPVAVGTKADLQPVLGGNGILLETGVDRRFVISKGTKFYIAATAANRVKFIIEPLPWLEQIAGTISIVSDAAAAFVKKFIGG